MTTPRVTEIPVAMAAVEPDPFAEVAPRAAAVQRRLEERATRARRADMVRRVIGLRSARSRPR